MVDRRGKPNTLKSTVDFAERMLVASEICIYFTLVLDKWYLMKLISVKTLDIR